MVEQKRYEFVQTLRFKKGILFLKFRLNLWISMIRLLLFFTEGEKKRRNRVISSSDA